MMKNKSMLTLVIFFAVVAVIGASGAFSVNRKDASDPSPAPLTAYDEIMATDLDVGYPQDPALVMDITNKITVYLYGGDVPEEQIEPLIQQQRKLYAKVLAAMNDEEAQIANVKAHLALLKSQDQRLLEIKAQPPIYDLEDSSVCSVSVIQYTNTKINNEVVYFLQKENDQWKIASFGLASDVNGFPGEEVPDEGEAAL